MQIGAITRLAEEYAKLGWAVQNQIGELLGGTPASELNPNAVEYAREWLGLVVDVAQEEEDEELEHEAAMLIDQALGGEEE